MDKDIRYKEMIGYLKESKEFIFINIVTMVFIVAQLSRQKSEIFIMN